MDGPELPGGSPVSKAGSTRADSAKQSSRGASWGRFTGKIRYRTACRGYAGTRWWKPCPGSGGAEADTGEGSTGASEWRSTGAKDPRDEETKGRRRLEATQFADC